MKEKGTFSTYQKKGGEAFSLSLLWVCLLTYFSPQEERRKNFGALQGRTISGRQADCRAYSGNSFISFRQEDSGQETGQEQGQDRAGRRAGRPTPSCCSAGSLPPHHSLPVVGMGLGGLFPFPHCLCVASGRTLLARKRYSLPGGTGFQACCIREEKRWAGRGGSSSIASFLPEGGEDRKKSLFQNFCLP